MFIYNLPDIPIKKCFKLHYKPNRLENKYDNIDTVDTVDTVDTFDTVDTVDTVDILSNICDPFSLFIFFCCLTIWFGNYTRIKFNNLINNNNITKYLTLSHSNEDTNIY